MIVKRIDTKGQTGRFRIRTVLKTSKQGPSATMAAVEVPSPLSRFRVRGLSSSGEMSPWAVQKTVTVTQKLGDIVGYRVCAVDIYGRRSPWLETAVMTGTTEDSPGVDLLQAVLSQWLVPKIEDDLKDIFLDLSAKTSKGRLSGTDESGYSASVQAEELGLSGLSEAVDFKAPYERFEEAINVSLVEISQALGASPQVFSELIPLNLLADVVAFQVLLAGPSYRALAYAEAMKSFAEVLISRLAKPKVSGQLSAVVSAEGAEDGYISEELRARVRELLADIDIDLRRSDGFSVRPDDHHENVAIPRSKVHINAVIDELPLAMPENLESARDSLLIPPQDRGMAIAEPEAESSLQLGSEDGSTFDSALEFKTRTSGAECSDIWAVTDGRPLGAYGRQEASPRVSERKDISLDTAFAQTGKFEAQDKPIHAPIIPASDILSLIDLILEYFTLSPAPQLSAQDSISVGIGYEASARVGFQTFVEACRAFLRQRFGAISDVYADNDRLQLASDSSVLGSMFGNIKDMRSLRAQDRNISAYTGFGIGGSEDAFIMGRFIMGVTPMGRRSA